MLCECESSTTMQKGKISKLTYLSDLLVTQCYMSSDDYKQHFFFKKPCWGQQSQKFCSKPSGNSISLVLVGGVHVQV